MGMNGMSRVLNLIIDVSILCLNVKRAMQRVKELFPQHPLRTELWGSLDDDSGC